MFTKNDISSAYPGLIAAEQLELHPDAARCPVGTEVHRAGCTACRLKFYKVHLDVDGLLSRPRG